MSSSAITSVEKDDDNVNYKTSEFLNEGESNDNIEEKNPEDEIPDLPENAKAREFLKKAPRKGLFMPLGKIYVINNYSITYSMI